MTPWPKYVDRLPCRRVHPGYDVFHPGGHLVEPRQQVPLQVAGLPVNVLCAMLDGIERRFPGTAWVVDHDFGEGPMVIELGRYIEELDDGDDDDVPVREAAALQRHRNPVGR